MTEGPCYRVFGVREVRTRPEGARIVQVWAELARRYLNERNGTSVPPGWRGQGAAESVYEFHRLIAEAPAGGGSATVARRFTLVVPSSWPVLTVREVADLRRVSPNAVRRALREGRLTGKRHRGGWLVPEDQARMWTPARRRHGSPAGEVHRHPA